MRLSTMTLEKLPIIQLSPMDKKHIQFSIRGDKLGRVVTKTETVNGDTNIFDYQYDLRGRLEEVKENGRHSRRVYLRRQRKPADIRRR